MKSKSKGKSPGPTKRAKVAPAASKPTPPAPVKQPAKAAKAAQATKAAKATPAPKASKTPAKPTPPAKPAPAKQSKQAPKADVDAEIPNSSSYTVLVDGERAWAATMNQTNIGQNNNKYYIIQLLTKGAGQFWVWNRWGRVGYPGQNAMKGPFSTVDKAKTEFNSKLKEKEKRGYIELEIVCESAEEVKEAPVAKGKGKVKAVKAAPALNPRVEGLVKLIFDQTVLNSTLQSLGYDNKKTPLGQLSQNNLKKGYEVLQEIEDELKKPRPSPAVLTELSGRFYTLIPHDFGFQHMSKFVINNMETVKTKIKMIECLGDMKITDAILKTGSEAEAQYQQLHCSINALDQNSQDYKDICQYFNTTCKDGYSRVEVLDVFEVEREGEAARMRNDIPNHQLLWHGSRVANFVGIISQGLRIAPPEAPCSGYRYGKGIYFADMAAKSADYCSPCDDGTALMLICEAALGNQNVLDHDDFNASKLPKGKHSVRATGTRVPGGYKDFAGAKMPWGPVKEVKSGYNMYNELIVYDISQARLRYLLKLKFK